MDALYWNGRDLEFRSGYRSPVGDGQSALVRVHLSGICSTDLQIFKGYMGFTGVPGHEFVGSVVEGPQALIDERVVGEINFACGNCDHCHRGLTRHCPARSVMGIHNADGAFAEYVSIPATNLHVVPEGVCDEEAVFTEPLAAAFEILEQIQVNPGDGILVLGDGKLGNLCAQVLRQASAHVTVLGKHEEKLKLVKHAGHRTIQLADWQPQQFDIVVEATGSAAGLQLALSAVRPRGTLVLKSTIAANHQVSLAPLVINEIAVIGSRCGLFPPALEALKEKRVSVTPMIEKIYALDDGIAAVSHAARPGTRKILLRP
ncbi:MAG TPA: alcohol dehydrogenase catalytic domain-containing protein [Candidatus Binatia bacterium]|jgi:threonine dehydrogenase-like Zn-dependent dehydrogenase